MCRFQFKIFSKRAFKQSVREAGALLRSAGRQQLENRRAALERGDYSPDDILAHLLKLYGTDHRGYRGRGGETFALNRVGVRGPRGEFSKENTQR